MPFNALRLRSSGGAAPTDPHFANVISLLHFDNDWTDVTGKVWTPHGTSVGFDTSIKVFGAAAGAFAGGGSNDYISTPDHADWDFGSGDFTVEGWFRRSSGGAFHTLFCQWDQNAGTKAPFLCYFDNTDHIQFLATTTNAAWDWFGVSSATYSSGVWYHVAICRDGSSIYGYVDGVSVVTPGTLSGAVVNNADNVTIGATASVNSPLAGYPDDFRATKGVARYPGGTTFTPPTAAFPDS